MRNRFEQQLLLGKLLIEDTEISTARLVGRVAELCAALKEIFINPEWNEKVFKILETKIYPKENYTGRPGMDLWQIFVLAQVRLCKNISYEELCATANQNKLVRQIMGIESDWGHEQIELSYQRIVDNVGLLDDETVKDLNKVILEFGQSKLKKKETERLQLKTDSFVVETNVHFPTDYNLLWDSARKCLNTIVVLQKSLSIEGWRKVNDWKRQLKSHARLVGRTNHQGGKTKMERMQQNTSEYITKSRALSEKLKLSYITINPINDIEKKHKSELLKYMNYLDVLIDQTERRIIKNEKIPQPEKIFSVFEEHTEWIKKGKQYPELGKKLSVTTDQYNLIVDYRIMENQADNAVVAELAKELLPKYDIKSWSFDKGYWKPENYKLLKDEVEILVLPKNGRKSVDERRNETRNIYQKLKNRHSAIESNINELEHRGLNRCPDKGYDHFKRYIGLAISAYNLKKIGKDIIENSRQKKLKAARIAA